MTAPSDVLSDNPRSRPNAAFPWGPFWAFALLLTLGFALWTGFSDRARYLNSRVESGYIAEYASNKELTLRLGSHHFPLTLVDTVGLQKPWVGQRFLVFLEDDQRLRVCATDCYGVAADSGSDLRTRLMQATTIGEREQMRKRTFEANKFAS